MSDQEKGDSIQIESREVSGEENFRKVLLTSLESEMVNHYGTFAGITAMKLVFRYILQDPKKIEEEASRISELWKKEAERVMLPQLLEKKLTISTAHPEFMKDLDWEGALKEALDSTAESIKGTLLDDVVPEDIPEESN